MSLFNITGATFSDCRKYRYRLWRVWDTSKPMIQFVGLNPSTANQTDDDNTIRRVVRFANEWGYGGVYMTNLFALVSPYPKDLLSCPDPIADNDIHLKEVAQPCSYDVVFAWGNFKEAKERAKTVSAMFPAAKALVVNKDGSPRHPLYVPANTILIPFK